MCEKWGFYFFPSNYSSINWTSIYWVATTGKDTKINQPTSLLGAETISLLTLLCWASNHEGKLNLCWLNMVKEFIPWVKVIRTGLSITDSGQSDIYLLFLRFIYHSKLVLIRKTIFAHKTKTLQEWILVQPTFISRWTIWLSWRYFNPSSICFV